MGFPSRTAPLRHGDPHSTLVVRVHATKTPRHEPRMSNG